MGPVIPIYIVRGFASGSDGKESACSAENPGSTFGSRRSPGERMATPSSILVWEISWTEELGSLQSMG